MNEWSQLPNAAHIDAVLASAADHPDQWRRAWSAARSAVWSAAYDAAYDAGREAEYSAASMCAANVASDTILALVAYDDCAYLLSMPLDQVQVLAALGLPAAVLLLPAMVAVEAIDILVVV